ncbi:MAG: hypothetical protein ACJ789_10595 [Thermomicrobiales bacterium]|jgi:hypothetical protein
MVQRWITKLFGMETWPREAQILKNTIDDDTPPPGDKFGADTPKAEQPAPGFTSQAEPETPIAH